MKNLGTRNKIIIGVVIGLLIVILGIILVLGLSKNEDKTPENTINISEKLASASVLEVVITEDKNIILYNRRITMHGRTVIAAVAQKQY